MILIIAFIVSLIPSIALYLWLKNKMKDDEAYKQNCKKALIAGLTDVVPVFLLSSMFAIVFRFVFGLDRETDMIGLFLHKFITLAFVEEAVKTFTGWKLLQKYKSYSWLDVIIYFGIVGVGFGLAEDIPYAIGADIPTMLIRGISIAHGSYAMIIGYFAGKGMVNGDKWLGAAGFAISWFIHGLYDFTLADKVEEITDWIAVIPVSLAILDVVLIVVFILFIRKARRNPLYTTPIQSDPEKEPAETGELMA